MQPGALSPNLMPMRYLRQPNHKLPALPVPRRALLEGYAVAFFVHAFVVMMASVFGWLGSSRSDVATERDVPKPTRARCPACVSRRAPVEVPRKRAVAYRLTRWRLV
jgi:hypothetical protein